MNRLMSAVVLLVCSASILLGLFLVPTSAQTVKSGSPTVLSRIYDTKKLLSQSVHPENVVKGRTLWLQRCAYCHDGVGQPTYRTLGPWIDAETVQTLGEDGVRTVVGSGGSRMPGFRFGLRPEQIDDLIVFLKTIQPDQKPTPRQLAGSQSTTANSE